MIQRTKSAGARQESILQRTGPLQIVEAKAARVAPGSQAAFTEPEAQCERVSDSLQTVPGFG